MSVKVEVYSPAVSGGPLVVYDSGEVNQRMMPGFPAVPRRTDIYTGQDSVASSGRWSMKVDNRDSVFSPDGLFAPDLRAVTCAVSVQGRLVFVGRATKLRYEQHGLVAVVSWRDFLDDFITQQVTGWDSIAIQESAIDEDPTVIAQAWLIETMRELGFPAYRTAGDVTIPRTDIPLWYPESTTTIRQWLLPVLAAVGLSYDWDATVSGGELTVGLRASWEGEFLNRARIPVFRDEHLFGSPTWDDGREQVANVWEGKRRFWDAAESRFQTEELEARVAYAPGSTAVVSREAFGERKSRVRLDMLREGSDKVVERANAILTRRLGEHPRARLKLRGRTAAELRVGDGFVSEFGLGVGGGRGLNRYWRVIGRTLVVSENARDSSTEVYAEMRDGRDEDYRDWYDAGRNTSEAVL